ncbi:MAG: hypothetical protein GX757_13335 [Clostridiales bacterium]|nr:hypothetical protein [Clostridiales bacterium]
MIGLAACSRQTEGRGQANGHIDNIAADIILEKSLLELVVDWCNSKLTEY